jgi:hypothetical protein
MVLIIVHNVLCFIFFLNETNSINLEICLQLAVSVATTKNHSSIMTLVCSNES